MLCDDPVFNSVAVEQNKWIKGFGDPGQIFEHPAERLLTFTGIQVLNPSVLDYIKKPMPASSIDAYSRMIAAGEKIKAYIDDNAYWQDIGTAERYKSAVFETMAPRVFQRVFPDGTAAPLKRQRIQGDGSDRQWFRLEQDQKSVILADHGIKKKAGTDAADAFFNIGRHLFNKGLPVPQIYDGDTLCGYVFVEDLGDLNLQTAVRQAEDSETVLALYQSALELLIQFSIDGADQFNAAWCYQTLRYDKSLILENECRYFVDAFLNTYLGFNYAYADFKAEFEFMAENALQHAVQGLMHRDFQSRNIMIKDAGLYVIDFQGARIGPLQYDLASLLIDPYVDLPPEIQSRLLADCLDQLAGQTAVKAAEFRHCYRFCCLTRNLQMLGAFGFLTRVKQKPHFEKYIPTAVRTLTKNLKKNHRKTLPGLCDLMDSIKDSIATIEKNKD